MEPDPRRRHMLVVAPVFFGLTLVSLELLSRAEAWSSEIWLPLAPQVAAFALAGWFTVAAPWLLAGAVLVPAAIGQGFEWGDGEGAPLFFLEVFLIPVYAAVAFGVLALRIRIGL